jgi:hypothetical protein
VIVAGGQLTAFTVELAGEIGCVAGPTIALHNEVSTIVAARDFTILLYETGRLGAFESGAVGQLAPELRNVSAIAASKEYAAAVTEEGNLALLGPRLKYAIPFFGDAIACCALSRGFGIAVCGTVSGSLVVCSLFEGTKVNVIDLGGGFRPIRVLITKAWGFIVTYGAGKTGQKLFVHTVNGRLVREAEIRFTVTAWCTWRSGKDFDFVMVANESGKLSVFEAFFLNMGDAFHRCYEAVVAMKYIRKQSITVVVLRDGRVVFLPYVAE